MINMIQWRCHEFMLNYVELYRRLEWARQEQFKNQIPQAA